jgi:hypothetical protein
MASMATKERVKLFLMRGISKKSGKKYSDSIDTRKRLGSLLESVSLSISVLVHVYDLRDNIHS